MFVLRICLLHKNTIPLLSFSLSLSVSVCLSVYLSLSHSHAHTQSSFLAFSPLISIYLSITGWTFFNNLLLILIFFSLINFPYSLSIYLSIYLYTHTHTHTHTHTYIYIYIYIIFVPVDFEVISNVIHTDVIFFEAYNKAFLKCKTI